MGFFKRLWDDMREAEEPGPECDRQPTPGAPQELIDAENRIPDCKFVQSCRNFFEDRGFLSAKQRRALTFSGTPNRRRRQFD